MEAQNNSKIAMPAMTLIVCFIEMGILGMAEVAQNSEIAFHGIIHSYKVNRTRRR
jgi:hypothetical protein